MVAVFLVSKKYVAAFFTHPVLEIDRTKGILISHLDAFQTNLSDIKDIAIIEEAIQEGDKKDTWYRLRFVLQDAEKLTPFAFTSYEKTHEIADIIMKKS